MKYLSLILFSSLLVACGGGSDGSDGSDGSPGASALVNVVDEAPGANCTYGGKRIDYGQDSNRNGTLDPGETTSTYVCSADPSGSGTTVVGSLVKVTAEPAGANCADGGQKVESGFDQDKDAVLDPSEVTETSYICNGSDGTNGDEALVSTSPEAAGANCTNGGTRVETGLDADGDSVLDAGEVQNVSYICDGADGSDGQDGTTALIAVSDEPAGANCINGGEKIESGLDSDANGTLEAGEVTSTSYVCDGADGTNGLNSLVGVSPEAAGANCTNGGQRIESGLDDDGDGILDTAEIDSTEYVCNLLADVLVETVEDSSLCMHGGVYINVGFDIDSDSILDSGEITSTDTICTNNTAPIIEGDDSLPTELSNYPVYIDDQQIVHIVGAENSRLVNPLAPAAYTNRYYFSEGFDRDMYTLEEDFLWDPDYYLILDDLEGDPVTVSLSGAPAWVSAEVIDYGDPALTNITSLDAEDFPVLHISGNVPDSTAGTHNFDLVLSDGEQSRTYPVSLEVRAFGPRHYHYQPGVIKSLDLVGEGVAADDTGFILPFPTYEGMSIGGSGSTGVSKPVLAKFGWANDSTALAEREFEVTDTFDSASTALYGNGYGVFDISGVFTVDNSLNIGDWDGSGTGDTSDQFQSVFNTVDEPILDASGNAYVGNYNGTNDMAKITATGTEDWTYPGQPILISEDGSELLVACLGTGDGDAHPDIANFCIASLDTATGAQNWIQTDMDGLASPSVGSMFSMPFRMDSSGAVYTVAGTLDSAVKYSAGSGAAQWATSLSAGGMADEDIMPAPNGDLYSWDQDGKVTRLDGATGAELWTNTYTTSPITTTWIAIQPIPGAFIRIEAVADQSQVFSLYPGAQASSLQVYHNSGVLQAEQLPLFVDTTMHNGSIYTFLGTGRGSFVVEKFDASTLTPQ